MQECSVHSLISLIFPWVQCQSLKPVLSQCSQTGFVTVDDFMALYIRSYVFYSHGCNKFLHARTFFTLADTTFILMFAMYLHARMFCTLAPYIFYSHGCNVRAGNLFGGSVAKPVLSQLIILLQCTLTHTSSIPMSAINFYMQEHILHSLI